MKIIIAPDSFKESLTAKEACDAIEKGILKVYGDAQCIKVPMADGGEGTFQSLTDATNGSIQTIAVHDPLGNIINANYGISGDGKYAFIEMAEASGLGLVPRDKRNPLLTSTYGTGELIKDAVGKGVLKIIIGIGGSATNDGGSGMIQALGGKLKDSDGNEIGFGGGNVSKLKSIDLSYLPKELKDVEIIVACDVDNPLTGPTGASYIFGPQKGADKDKVEELDSALKNFAKVIRKDLNIDVEHIKGAGAAGGLGAGLMAFLDGKLKKGIDIVMEYTNLEEQMVGADLVITGEGGIDSQTRFGKTPYGVAKCAKKYNIPVIALAGNVKEDSKILYDYGFDAIFSIMQGPSDLEEAFKKGFTNLETTTESVMKLIKVSKRIKGL